MTHTANSFFQPGEKVKVTDTRNYMGSLKDGDILTIKSDWEDGYVTVEEEVGDPFKRVARWRLARVEYKATTKEKA